MLVDNLFSGIVDFTDGSLSGLVGITGSATLGSTTITGVDSTIIPGLTSGLPVRALPEGILDPGTVIISLGPDSIDFSNPVGYDGSANFYIGLTSGNYLLNNALFVDVNNIYNVNDIPDYEIGASGGLGISPFAVYTQGRYNDQKNLKAIYEKYIITKVLSRNPVTNRFSAIVTWGFSDPAPSSVNTGQTVLPIVQLSPLNLLPPIIDYRAFSYKNLPEGQPFNQEILQVLDFGGSGGQGVGAVYSQSQQIVGGTTGIPFANSFNFIDGPEDQLEYIDAYIDPLAPPGVGNVIVSVKTPGLQKSTIGILYTLTVSENVGTAGVSVFRTLSGESDKFVPSLVRVNYSYQDLTAVEGTDYTFNNGYFDFTPSSPGQFSFTFTVANDIVINPDGKYFNINYDIDPTSTGSAIFAWNGGGPGQTGATGTTYVHITDDDTPSSSSFKFGTSSTSQYEPKNGNNGSEGTSYTIPVSWNPSTSGTVGPTGGNVTISLTGGSAIRGTDYVIYRNGSIDSVNSSWVLYFESSSPTLPISIVPLRNTSRFDTNTNVTFSLSSPNAYGQPSVVFPSSVGNPSTFTFNILEADISTVSTFQFTQSSAYPSVPEGQTGSIAISRTLSTFLPGFPQSNNNVNYWQSTNPTIDLSISDLSTAVKGTDYSPIWEVSDTLVGPAVQSLNYSGATTTRTVNFGTVPSTLSSISGVSQTKYIRIGTLNDGIIGSPARSLKTSIGNATSIVNSVNRGETGSPNTASFNITDPSSWAVSTISISPSSQSVTQPAPGQPNAQVTFTVTRSKGPGDGVPDPINLNYVIESVDPNGAIEGVNYSLNGQPNNGTISFGATDDSFTFTANILPDAGNPGAAIQEGNKKFRMKLISPFVYSSPPVPNLAVAGNLNAEVTIQDTFNVPTYNRTFFYFHGGAGPGYPSSPDLTTATSYSLPSGTTSSLSDVITAMIAGTTTTGFFTQVQSFTLGNNLTLAQAGAAGFTWTYLTAPVVNVAPGVTQQPNQYYYLAVPTNAGTTFEGLYYPEDLTTSVIANMHLQINGNKHQAASKKPFTYNNQGYILYRLGLNASTQSWVVGFA